MFAVDRIRSLTITTHPCQMTLRVADTRELLGWILHFGSDVRVIQPESLRKKVREEARKIFQDE